MERSQARTARQNNAARQGIMAMMLNRRDPGGDLPFEAEDDAEEADREDDTI